MTAFQPGEDIAPPPPGLAFTPLADAGGTDRDVLLGYQIFLGRDPESSFVIADAKNSPVGAFIRALMASGEFQSAVLDKLAAGRPLPHDAAAAAPSQEQLDWLFALLRVPPRAEAVLRAAPSWAEFLRTIVAVPGFPAAPARAAVLADGGPAQADAASGFILIQVENPKPGDRLAPGAQLQGNGWAIAPADVASIEIELDGHLLTHATYGLPRPDVARRFPHYRHVDHCGFTFSAEIPHTVAATGATQLLIKLRTVRGEVGSKGVRLAQPDARAASEEAAAGPESAWPIRLAIEEASIDADRRLRVRGWAVGAAPLRAIVVGLGDTELGETQAGLRRPDIATAHPSYPGALQAGFAYSADLPPGLPPGPNFVRVQATDTQGVARQTIVPVVVPPALPAGRRKRRAAVPAEAADSIDIACDEASLTTDGMLRLAGWAAAAEGAPTVRIDLDSITLGEARLTGLRPDIAARFPKNPAAARAGFAFAHRLPRAPKPGVHTISLLATLPEGARRLVEFPVVAEAPAPGAAAAIAVPEAYEPAGINDDPPISVPGMRLEIDRPAIQAGAARDPIRGAFTVSGWAAARHGIAEVAIHCDEDVLGHAHLGMRREDIGAAYPDYEGSLLAGFALVLPPGTLPQGNHLIRVVARAAPNPAGATLPVFERRFRITAEPYEALPPGAEARPHLPPAEAAAGLALLEASSARPLFGIVIAGDDDEAALAITLASLEAQAYPHWRRFGEPAPQRARKTADLVIRLRAGDRLAADALLELALAAGRNPRAAFLYADELRHDPAQSRRQPFFKPAWSPELLLATNYIGRLWAATPALLRKAGLTPATLAAATDYDAVLRVTEQAGTSIANLSHVLAERGPVGDSPAEEQDALHAALARRAIAGRAQPGAAPGTWRIQRALTDRTIAEPSGTKAGLVSIIMPTCAARGLVRTALKTIRATTAPALPGGRAVEIILLDNTPVRDTKTRAWLRRNADVVIDMPGEFNWSRFNNVGARAATGEYLLFLNDDIEATTPGWLEAMLEHAQRPEVGVVGARLLYPDGKVQHGGQYLSGDHARHAFRFAANTTPGPFGLAQVAREMISVTGACQMIRAEIFASLGGFEEAHSVVNNDIDLCLRAWAAGLSVIYTPHATLIHHELASRAALEDSYDVARFHGAWRTRFALGDPYRSPRLGPEADHYGADPEPAVILHAGRRGPSPESVRRILAVKLDHIGDFLTALPAIRRLKQAFPNAALDLLAPAATAELARHEPAIAHIETFDFFHARSGRGQKPVGEADFQALRARLSQAAYDIAIDLRMQPETRQVLPYTGARLLAGYDHANRFPFLHVALEWEGDTRLAPKRAHIAERLIQLVSATLDACQPPPAMPPAAKLEPAKVPALAALPSAFLARKLVCIHPGVGNVVRQWPAAHYASLIDLLAEAGLHSVLVGGPDDAPIAEEIMRRLGRPGCAEALAGRVPLADLAAVMRACVLFVGNNSGPKHLAASLGMPTVGIHSGVVDATEWGPLGQHAIAIRRQMVCSPCYLEFAADCPRSLACLTGLRPRDVFNACLRFV